MDSWYRPKFKIDRDWSDYPIGSTANNCNGGGWNRTPRGWKSSGGSTFPRPGGDAVSVSFPPGYELNQAPKYPSKFILDAFREGVKEGDLPRINRLIGNYGVDVFRDVGNPLCTAIEHGQREAFDFLLGHGFSATRPDEYQYLRTSTFGSSKPPLSVALQRDQREMAVVLVQHGADPEARCPMSGVSAVEKAENSSLYDFAQMLRAARAKVVAEQALSEFNLTLLDSRSAARPHPARTDR